MPYGNCYPHGYIRVEFIGWALRRIPKSIGEITPPRVSLRSNNTGQQSGYCNLVFQRPRYHRLAFRQPAATASASLQNHRSPYSGRMIVSM